MESSKFQCRMYENKFPDIDEVVMVNVRQIADMGAYVKLLEYDNIEGMILMTELSRRRIRSIQRLIRVGKNEVVLVLKIDKEKDWVPFFFFMVDIFWHGWIGLAGDEEESRFLAKRKMLGNIKFIGELGKLEMLHDSILHRCCEQASSPCHRVLCYFAVSRIRTLKTRIRPFFCFNLLKKK